MTIAAGCSRIRRGVINKGYLSSDCAYCLCAFSYPVSTWERVRNPNRSFGKFANLLEASTHTTVVFSGGAQECDSMIETAGTYRTPPLLSQSDHFKTVDRLRELNFSFCGTIGFGFILSHLLVCLYVLPPPDLLVCLSHLLFCLYVA